LNNISIEKISEKTFKISENETQNQIDIIFKGLNKDSETGKTITLLGKGSLKVMVNV